METRDFLEEFAFQASRSGGAGGQHVNKVSSRVELRFNVLLSDLLNEEEKQKILLMAGRRISKLGILRIVSQKERSQRLNKEECIRKFYLYLESCLKEETVRKATRPTALSNKKKRELKKRRSEKKTERQKIRNWET